MDYLRFRNRQLRLLSMASLFPVVAASLRRLFRHGTLHWY